MLALRAITESLADDMELFYARVLLGYDGERLDPGSIEGEGEKSTPDTEGESVEDGTAERDRETKALSSSSTTDDPFATLDPKVAAANLEEEEAVSIKQNFWDVEISELLSLRGDPERFRKLAFKIMHFYQLPKDAGAVEDFLELNWDRSLKFLIGKGTALDLSKSDLAAFLRGHIERVIANREENRGRIWQHDNNSSSATSAWYSLAEDFLYDNSPLPSEVVDERNMDFPLEKMGPQMAQLLDLVFGGDTTGTHSKGHGSLGEQDEGEIEEIGGKGEVDDFEADAVVSEEGMDAVGSDEGEMQGSSKSPAESEVEKSPVNTAASTADGEKQKAPSDAAGTSKEQPKTKTSTTENPSTTSTQNEAETSSMKGIKEDVEESSPLHKAGESSSSTAETENDATSTDPSTSSTKDFSTSSSASATSGQKPQGETSTTITETDFNFQGEHFQHFLYALEKIGLRTWLKSENMSAELEAKFPRGHEKTTSKNIVDALMEENQGSEPSHGGADTAAWGFNTSKLLSGGGRKTRNNRRIISPSLQSAITSANFMLRCASRGKTNLLEFEACDPYKLLHDIPTLTYEQELAQDASAMPPLVPDNVVSQMLQSCVLGQVGGLGSSSSGEQGQGVGAGLGGQGNQESAAYNPANNNNNNLNDPSLSSNSSRHAATVREVIEAEMEFQKNAGPLEWSPEDGEFKWKVPENVIYNPQRQTYVKQQKGSDPLLKLSSFRQVQVQLSRMASMTGAGRVFYWRSLMLVGNGRGIYGFGVGFGMDISSAKKALQRLDHIDLDEGRVLTTPVRGREYGQWCTIHPRAIGRGLQCNKKFLPLMYLLGLDNCKIGFRGSQWFTRVRAIRRALEGMYSRKTMANATGQRYALLTAPGDHWMHWPDRWFDPIRESYIAKVKAAKLKRRQMLQWRKKGNVIAHQGELKPGWTKYAWLPPIQKWIQKDVEANQYLFNVKDALTTRMFNNDLTSSPDKVAQRLVEDGSWTCTSCGFRNFSERRSCFKCGASASAGAAEVQAASS
ncbi:unnamed protein product [Amoebophrya sp. A25]|nr:unnamed protein product [Amoebophrya sp. A25]|eukprot:GSA25T00022328001.1